MKNRQHIVFVASFLFIQCFAAAPALAGDVDALIKSCAGCHGAKGVSTNTDVPTIAGIPAIVHEDAWFAYKEEARPCVASKPECSDCGEATAETDMCTIAATLSEDDIVAIAAHFAELPYVPMKQDFDAASATAGAALHEQECSRCHSDGGSNPEDEAGILAGQPKGYLERTFAEYRSGDREQPKKMKSKIDALSDDDVVALVNFYASQQ